MSNPRRGSKNVRAGSDSGCPRPAAWTAVRCHRAGREAPPRMAGPGPRRPGGRRARRTPSTSAGCAAPGLPGPAAGARRHSHREPPARRCGRLPARTHLPGTLTRFGWMRSAVACELCSCYRRATPTRGAWTRMAVFDFTSPPPRRIGRHVAVSEAADDPQRHDVRPHYELVARRIRGPRGCEFASSLNAGARLAFASDDSG